MGLGVDGALFLVHEGSCAAQLGSPPPRPGPLPPAVATMIVVKLVTRPARAEITLAGEGTLLGLGYLDVNAS